MYLLDTNVVSELRRLRPHGAVLAWLESIPAEPIYLSAVTLGEIQAGIERTRDRDPEKATEIEAWVDQVEQTSTVLPLDGRTFRIWARLMHHRSNDFIEDAMIAATALRHGLTVVTRNVRDFESFGVQILNPFVTDR
jgi:predicted nucleic acid-binding protein